MQRDKGLTATLHEQSFTIVKEVRRGTFDTVLADVYNFSSEKFPRATSRIPRGKDERTSHPSRFLDARAARRRGRAPVTPMARDFLCSRGAIASFDATTFFRSVLVSK